MPTLKLFKHFVTEREDVESLSQQSPPPPAETNPLAKQQQTSALGTRTPIPNTPGYFSRTTETTSTLEQEDGVIHYHTGSNSKTTIKQVSNVPQTLNASHQLQDPQHTSNHLSVGEVDEITSEQVNCRHQKPKHGLQTDTKRHRNQHRLCYKCRQKGHFTKNCPQYMKKRIN